MDPLEQDVLAPQELQFAGTAHFRPPSGMWSTIVIVVIDIIVFVSNSYYTYVYIYICI